MGKIWGGSAILIALMGNPAHARDAVIEQTLTQRLGTLSSQAAPVFTEGVLTGCGVTFAALIRDFTYRTGGFARVDGSFNLMTAKNNIGILLKVVVNDFEDTTYRLMPNAPVSAFFVSGNATSRPYLVNQSLGTDTPGAIVAVYNAEQTFAMLLKAVGEGVVTIAFARKKGGTDMQVPIDLSIDDTDDSGKKIRSTKAASTFMQCASDLVDAEQQRLKSRK
ncbi:hypothetical protein ACVW1A_002174 [Bradyrhizobium sp. LB1.3]